MATRKSIDGYMRASNNPGAALNTDNEALKAYKLKKQKNTEIDNLKNEVKDIKNLLSVILEKLNK